MNGAITKLISYYADERQIYPVRTSAAAGFAPHPIQVLLFVSHSFFRSSQVIIYLLIVIDFFLLF